ARHRRTRSGSWISRASATSGAPTGSMRATTLTRIEPVGAPLVALAREINAGYYAHAPARNPRGPAAGDRRVSRGGAWRHADPWSSVAHRSSLPPHLRYADYGVRLARDLAPREGRS